MIADPRLPRSGGGFLPAGNVPVFCQTTCRNFFPNEESFICLYCVFIYLLLIVHALILADLLHREGVSTKKDRTCEMKSILHYCPSYGANGRMIGV